MRAPVVVDGRPHPAGRGSTLGRAPRPSPLILAVERRAALAGRHRGWPRPSLGTVLRWIGRPRPVARRGPRRQHRRPAPRRPRRRPPPRRPSAAVPRAAQGLDGRVRRRRPRRPLALHGAGDGHAAAGLAGGPAAGRSHRRLVGARAAGAVALRRPLRQRSPHVRPGLAADGPGRASSSPRASGSRAAWWRLAGVARRGGRPCCSRTTGRCGSSPPWPRSWSSSLSGSRAGAGRLVACWSRSRSGAWRSCRGSRSSSTR